MFLAENSEVRTDTALMSAVYKIKLLDLLGSQAPSELNQMINKSRGSPKGEEAGGMTRMNRHCSKSCL